MEVFKFNGEWEFKMNLEKFMDSNKNWGNSLGRPIINRPIRVKIVDRRDYEPDPLNEQLNTLNYVIQNQSKVLDALCKAMVKINLDHAERDGLDDWYPKNLDQNNLGEWLLISELEILIEHKNDYAYYQISGEYKGDMEHGIIIVMHGEVFLEHSAVGEMDYEEVYNDLGDRARTFIDFNISSQEFGENQTHKVLPKYNKYKPWQEEAMSDYLNKLIRTKQNEKLKEIIDQGVSDINYPIDYYKRTLVDLAALYENIEIMELLIKKGADFSNSIKAATTNSVHIRIEAVRLLVKHGASIDTLNNSGDTPLQVAISQYVSAINRGSDKEAETQKKHIEFFLSIGANPAALNKDGDDYKTILHKRKSPFFLEKTGIINTIEDFIKAFLSKQ